MSTDKPSIGLLWKKSVKILTFHTQGYRNEYAKHEVILLQKVDE